MAKHARRRTRRNYRDAWRDFADRHLHVPPKVQYAGVSLMMLFTAALSAYTLVRTG